MLCCGYGSDKGLDIVDGRTITRPTHNPHPPHHTTTQKQQAAAPAAPKTITLEFPPLSEALSPAYQWSALAARRAPVPKPFVMGRRECGFRVRSWLGCLVSLFRGTVVAAGSER